MPEIMPTMLTLCLMLLLNYYAKNYVGIIDLGFLAGHVISHVPELY